MSAKVYIAYAMSGVDYASMIAEALENRGIMCWYAARDLTDSDGPITSVYNAISSCTAAVILVDEGALDSLDFAKEVSLAEHLNKAMYIIRLYEGLLTPRLSYYLAVHQWLDGRKLSLDQLADKLAEQMATLSPVPEINAEQKLQGKTHLGESNYIFISYSHKNTKVVLAIIKELQKRGYRVWYDEGIDPGTEWDEYIAEKVDNCGYMIAFISSEYLESDNCKDELNYARDLNKKRLLVYLKDVALPRGMAMRLNRLQAIHKYKYSDMESFMNKLMSADGISEFRD